MDLKLDPATGDLDLSSGTIELVDGVDAIGQQVAIRLQFFLGEWFLDERIGLPYFEEIIGQKLRKNIVDEIFKDTILTVPGIAKFEAFSLLFDGITRTLTISFTATTDTSEPLVFERAFILGETS